jgi:hypothetical protein
MKRKRKPTSTMAALTQVSSIRHLRLNKRGGRPGANVSPIFNCLQHVFTTKSLLSNPQRLTHSGHDHCPTGTSKSGGVRHSKCHPIEQTSQITMVAARRELPHNLHLKPAEI